MPAEEVEQQFAGRPGDAGDRFASPNPNGLRGPCPLKLESRTVWKAATALQEEPSIRML
jgi:hypothetical protein